MSGLRIVTGDTGAPSGPMADAARAALEVALAAGATVVVILYETPRTIGWATVPSSDALLRGMIETVRDMSAAPSE